MEFKKYSGAIDLTKGKTRSEKPETILIREALTESATSGEMVVIAALKPAEVEQTMKRIPQIATRHGFHYRMSENEDGNGVVVFATFKEEKPKEKEEEAKPTPATTAKPRRTTKKAVARA